EKSRYRMDDARGRTARLRAPCSTWRVRYAIAFVCWTSRSRLRCALSRPTRRSSLASDIGSVVSRRAIAPTSWRSIRPELRCWTPGSPECEPNHARNDFGDTSIRLEEIEEWRATLVG